MASLPRLAVGTIQSGTDLRPALWGLLEAFREREVQVQGFLSRACFTGYLEEATITGTRPRHLDSWLMSADQCRQAMLAGSANSDLAVVEGDFSIGGNGVAGGRLDTLCQWLDLPRVAVLDVSRLELCRWPARPERIDGLVLDRVADEAQLARMSTELETLWGVPVVGAMPEAAKLRREVLRLPEGVRPSRGLRADLGRAMTRYSNLGQVLTLAARREFPWTPQAAAMPLFPSHAVVAVAYDDAFNCYFPDTLDGLESGGATMVDFSPLRDDRLPRGVDVVYLGCGHPERHAAALSRNHCMKLALRNHVRGGGRVYAEGGGLAYLCQDMETPGEGLQRMAGIFPAIARLRPSDGPAPIQVVLDRTTWIGHRGTVLRGYCNPAWDIEPVGELAGCVAPPHRRHEMVGVGTAVGSRVHLNFAAQPGLLPGFFRRACCCQRM